MKNLFLVLALSFLTVFSCSSGSDDNNTVEDNALLLRQWYLVSSNFGSGTVQAPECSNGNVSYIEFTAPNIHKSYTWDNDDNCDYFLEASGSWSREGVLITIEYDQPYPDEVYTINELTATTLSFVTSDGDYFVYSSIK